ncbi:uncharacterized protein LOC123316014 [Coccinella septempunctata]|uniref:uncharacterized protein LOC123316014 n=1 Tax=Coccinella septempunctata TaxID=41139 RepID=UPI001D085297|nr:uncharacterized protein LOC123316014 [Coccinella septempunctata]
MIVMPILVHSLENTAGSQKSELPSVNYQGVQGKPGLDFPVLTAIPKTSFSCRDIETGYYADLETNCQVFHICEDGKKTSFLCPNGTIFQQSDLICDWWFKVNCTNSPLLYEESSEQLKEELIKKKSSRRLTHKGSDKYRLNWGSQKKSPTNQEAYEDKKDKANSKQNWSSVYNEPQWSDKGKNRNLDHALEYKTIENTSTTTEIPKRKQSNYRKIVMRKRPTGETKQITNTAKHRDTSGDSTRNTYEENIMTVTPETTTKFISSTSRKRFQYKDFQKPYSSTISNKVQEATTTSGFYISRRANQTSSPNIPTQHKNNDNTKSDLDKEPRYQNEYVNIFVGTRQKVLRANNYRVSNNLCKSCQKNTKLDSPTKYLNGDSNTLSEDSDETQVPQETASIVDSSRYKNFNRNKVEKTNGYYENHKPEYTEIKDPRFYNEKYFNNIVPVTSQYVTTQSFNTRKTFVGSSVGTPIPRNQTTNNRQSVTLNIGDHNRKTFKLSAIAFNTAQALNPFQNEETAFKSPVLEVVNTPAPIKPTQELSTISFNTVEPFDPYIRTDGPSTKATADVAKETFEPSTEPSNTPTLNPLSKTELNSEPVENDKDVLKISTISLNTAQAYESLFSEESRSPVQPKPTEEKTELPPLVLEVPNNTAPSTDPPFTSRRLEIPTTLEPGYPDEVEIRFKEDPEEFHHQVSSSTEGSDITTTPIPTRAPLPRLKPRPFEVLSTESSSLGVSNDKSEKFDEFLPYPFFKISTASPFSLPEVATQNDNYLGLTEAPTTEPTNFYIKPDGVSVNDDGQKSSETFRPGLVVPSSVSPLTLHTLAAYFENALSNMTSEERENLDLNDDNVDMEEKLRALLSHMTRQKYEQLFKQMESDGDDTVETTTVKEADYEDSEENPEDTQKVRKLAKLFSQALSDYLNDPMNFKNRLIQVRPTEPPSEGYVFSTEKELLSFSEDDSKNTLASLYNSTWSFITPNKTEVNADQNNNFIGSEGEGLSIADSQSFISQFNSLNYEDKQKVGSDNLPKNHWTSSPHATNLWRTTFAVDPFSLNKDFLVTESYTAVATETEPTETYSEVDPPSISSEEQEEIKYELRVFPKLPTNSSKLQGILIDFMNSSTTSESERLHRILRKLNTTEDEFLDRMKKIEENPLTRRLILLLIHECESTRNEKEELIPFLNPERKTEDNFSTDSGSVEDDASANKDQDARALQLLNSLYNIATKFGR